MEKLNHFGFSQSLIKLFCSYLRQRQFCVKYRNFTSKPFVPTSGVPQGSNLGPLLFLLFINDLADNITCQKLMFADDFKLFTKINGIQDCVVLQMCLDLACTWCTENRLKLNIAKCKVVSYTRRNQTTYFDYNINRSVLERLDIFCPLVRSRLVYGAIIWSPIYAVHRSNLEAIQRKFLK